jgi:hypothetical protein
MKKSFVNVNVKSHDMPEETGKCHLKLNVFLLISLTGLAAGTSRRIIKVFKVFISNLILHNKNHLTYR